MIMATIFILNLRLMNLFIFCICLWSSSVESNINRLVFGIYYNQRSRIASSSSCQSGYNGSISSEKLSATTNWREEMKDLENESKNHQFQNTLQRLFIKKSDNNNKINNSIKDNHEDSNDSYEDNVKVLGKGLLSCNNVVYSSRGGGSGKQQQQLSSSRNSFFVKKTMTFRQMEAAKLFAGGIAGTVSSCFTNPLEVIKMQLQSSIVSVSAGGSLLNARGHPITIAKNILKQDGISGLFRGLPPTLIGIIPSRSAYFYAYQRCKHLLGNLDHKIGSLKIVSKNNDNHILQEGSPINSMVSGLVAGIVSNTITNPIWMIKTRMTLLADTAVGQKAYLGYGDVIMSIFREEGMKGFYKGIQASYWGCFEGSIQFLLYEQIKTRLIKRKRNKLIASGILKPKNSLSSSKYNVNNNNDNIELSLRTYFWSAAISKMLASIITYPHEVVRTRLREQARSGIFKYKGMWQSITLIAKEEGRIGLYSGMGVHLLKVVPNSALMFVTYEIVRNYLNDFTVID